MRDEITGRSSRDGAIGSGGHQVVGFVALRQNKPAQSGRLGGGQGCALPQRRDCSQREQFHLPVCPPLSIAPVVGNSHSYLILHPS